MSEELKEGMVAPDFSYEEEGLSLAGLRGRKVVLYFYPKDNTPGCTREACGFRDLKQEFEEEGAVIIGVSKDSAKSHTSFTEKFQLNFPLIPDTDQTIIKAYQVLGEKKLYGKVSVGLIRSTFLIDQEGVIRKIWRNVKVDGHMDKVLAEVRSMG